MIRTYLFKFCCLQRCNRPGSKTERRKEKKRKSKKDGESEKLQDYPKKPMG
jgi:hypothetical protein